jgi:hypothetical protein
MAYIGQAPANKAVSASDIEDGIITNAKLAQDIISAETELAETPADTDEFLISDAGVLKRLDASLVGGGKIGQVVSTTKTDTFSASVGTGSDSALITGLTVDITPSASNSKILIFVNTLVGSDGEHALSMSVFRDTTQIDLGDASSNRKRVSKGRDANYFGGGAVASLQTNFLDTPSTTSQITYGIKIRHSSSLSKTLHINKTHDDTDNSTFTRGTSTITAIEVLA